MSESISNKDRVSSKETLDILLDLSRLLNSGLDKSTLATCVTLIEAGVNPESLANVVRKLQAHASSRDIITIPDLNSPAL
ncbi:hypothetical protein SISSUDRAFT_1062399 [Sistotremastrum suecicum HHB10207 ss-3]|uniref:Mitotic-spindle organizing protein 1 n=1 Tax=Sistotremastrum suecicum HHB10207 ss-3 TaxID=1314776 RepID=A0A166CXB0_9AGAM|nr:hypothetical protein SISSUDRAFT_1062399 [Sistotremastrum suecicum HHB10207 ss-3]